MKFTFEKGTTNHHREAYFAGWEIVRILLENEIPAYIECVYKETSVCK